MRASILMVCDSIPQKSQCPVTKVVSYICIENPADSLRPSLDCAHRASQRVLPAHLQEANRGSPGSRAWSFHTCWRSPTTQGLLCPHPFGHKCVAFRSTQQRRHPVPTPFNTPPVCSPVNASPAPL